MNFCKCIIDLLPKLDNIYLIHTISELIITTIKIANIDITCYYKEYINILNNQELKYLNNFANYKILYNALFY